MFYGIPHKERDVCSVMQETGREFFFSKYGLRPTTLRGKKYRHCFLLQPKRNVFLMLK